MTPRLGHVVAAMRRTLRQQWRARLVVLAVASAATLAAVTVPEAATLARTVGGLAFGCLVAVAVTTIGVPGDDLASGALAQDLLAGTSPAALVVGAVLGTLVAAMPAAAGVAVLVPLPNAPAATIAASLAIVALGALALAAVAVALGTLLAGRNASLFAVFIAFLGFLPPDAIRLEQQGPAVNAALQNGWRLLPLPHHVVAAVQALELGAPVLPHVAPLVAGTLAAVALGVGVLHLRIVTGRWS